MIYPWQQEQWQQSLQLLSGNRLAHAILISGPPDIGKLDFCLSYMQRINCTQATKDDYACGICKDCHLFLARSHPDVRLINIDESVEQIKVDEIREINQFIMLSRQQGTYKIICIDQAERMNLNAANALLKTLEEPPANSVLFLISDNSSKLLATIKSRCQTWKFGLPNKQLALDWLQQQSENAKWDNLLSVSGFRPLYALELHETGQGELRTVFYHEIDKLMRDREKVTKISANLQNEELETLVNWQQSWCSDLVRCHFEMEPVTLENPDFRRSLHSLVGQVDLQLLFRFLGKLIEFRRFSSASLNKRLFIEDMLIQCQEILIKPI